MKQETGNLRQETRSILIQASRFVVMCCIMAVIPNLLMKEAGNRLFRI